MTKHVKYNIIFSNRKLKHKKKILLETKGNRKRIKELIKNKNLSIEEIANQLNLDNQQLENKLNGKEEFYLEEMHKLKEILNLTIEEAENLFFKEESKL